MRMVLKTFVVFLMPIGIAYCSASESAPARSALSDKCGAIAKPVGSVLSLVVAGNTVLAVDLYKKITAKNRNTFFSPYSISCAFAMTWAGARGQTEKEIAQALHFPLTQENLHRSLNALDFSIKKSAKTCGFELNVVNQLWGEKSFTIQPEYLRLISVIYGAGIRLLDFRNQPEPSRLIINEWVRKQTYNRIADLIPKDGINDSTKLVITNAIYFKAQWEHQFNSKNTSNGKFTTSTGDFVQAQFMSQCAEFFAVKTNEYQVVSLPYRGKEISMLVIMPESGKMESVESELSGAFIQSVTNSLSMEEIKLRLPKFKFTTNSINLNPILISLGMLVPFQPSADFSGIDGKKEIIITDVYHKAFISVNEKETEAAAATTLIMGSGGMPQPPPVYSFDRPFIFLIRDNKTGTILFMGKINDPTKE